MQLRIGNGCDMHRLLPGRALILGGQQLEHPGWPGLVAGGSLWGGFVRSFLLNL